MKSYPKVGSRVVVTDGPHKGRQAVTMRTEDGRGQIDIWLIGGCFKIGVRVPLAHVEKDRERRVRKLPPRPIAVGDRLFSLEGMVWMLGHHVTLTGQRPDGSFDVKGEHWTRSVLKPAPGFEKRWAHASDAAPVMLPACFDASAKRSTST